MSRSQNSELHEGATDGKYRKRRPNTHVAPGLGDELVKANRASLHPFLNYEFSDTEESVMVSPGEATTGKTNVPAYNSTPVADVENYMQAGEQ